MQPAAGKQLFAHPYRPRRRSGSDPGGRPERLLNGQAMAEAQRLSRPRLRAQVFVMGLMAADVVVLLIAGLAARLVSAGLDQMGGLSLAILWSGTLCTLAGVRLAGGYALWRLRVPTLAIPRMLAGLGLGMLAAAAVLGLADAYVPAKAVWLGLWAALALAAMGAARALVAQRLAALTRVGTLEHRLAVVGGGPGLAPAIRALTQARAEGYRLCGFFDDRRDGRSPDVVAGLHKMGDLRDLVEFVRIAQVDTVVVAIPDLTRARLLEMLGVLTQAPVEIRTLPAQGLGLASKARRSRIGALDLVELCRPPLSLYAIAGKRVFDLVTASLAIVLLAPVLAAVALAVRWDSPGPILFRQTRHGFNNKPIKVLKFRSMYADLCDPTAVRAVRQGDARVTRVGRVIRKTSLDELPQLFNVLSGELSMVGPRPHATAARTGDILFDAVTERYSARSRVKPGITGWAQINGWRGEMNSAEKIRQRVEHDIYYIENWSLWLDVKILARTPGALIGAKNAY